MSSGVNRPTCQTTVKNSTGVFCCCVLYWATKNQKWMGKKERLVATLIFYPLKYDICLAKNQTRGKQVIFGKFRFKSKVIYYYCYYLLLSCRVFSRWKSSKILFLFAASFWKATTDMGNSLRFPLMRPDGKHRCGLCWLNQSNCQWKQTQRKP